MTDASSRRRWVRLLEMMTAVLTWISGNLPGILPSSMADETETDLPSESNCSRSWLGVSHAWFTQQAQEGTQVPSYNAKALSSSGLRSFAWHKTSRNILAWYASARPSRSNSRESSGATARCQKTPSAIPSISKHIHELTRHLQRQFRSRDLKLDAIIQP